MAVVLLSVRAASAQTPSAPIYIDDSPAALDLIHEARHLREQDRITEAAAKYQQVLEQYPFKLVSKEEGLYIDIRQRVHEILLADKQLLEAYQEQFEPEARRELDEAMRRWGNDAKLLRIARRYSLTPAGLEATLNLASLQLERGTPLDAQSILQTVADHPLLSRRAPHYYLLVAASAMLVGQNEKFAVAEQQLRTLNAKAELEVLGTWRKTFTVPDKSQWLNARNTLPEVELPRSLQAPLWAVRFDTHKNSSAPSHARLSNAGSGSNNSAVPPYLLEPTVVGDTLIGCDGSTVQAIDRMSGRIKWTYAPRDHDVRQSLGSFATMSQWVDDPRGVALEENRLFTVVGRVSNTQYGWRLKLHQTWLTCLNALDGRVLWRKNPSDLDESMNVAFFHGTPIVDQGRLYVMVRRNQNSGFNSAFVMALSTVSGDLLWRRHLSSAAVTRGATMQALGKMALSGNHLYVTDNLGAVAKIDARSGSVAWLNMLASTPSSKELLQERKPLRIVKQPGPPMVAEAGVIIPAFDPSSATVLIDPTTGKVVRELIGEEWDPTDQYFSTQHGLLAIGSNARMLDPKTLDARWKRDLNEPSPRLEAAGVAITGRVAVIPQQNHIKVISLEDGSDLSNLQIDATGSVLPVAGQLLVSDDQSIRSYTEWGTAYDNLQQRMQQEKENPFAGLALAHLAATSQRWDVMLEGLDAAIFALDRRELKSMRLIGAKIDPVQHAVFRQIRTLADPESLPESDQRRNTYLAVLHADPSLRQALFDRLSSVSATPADEVAYQLSAGQYMEKIEQPRRALEHYQSVLSDPTLATQLYQHRSGSRQARLEARIRIKELVASQPDIYEPFELQARQRLDELSADPSTTPEEFLSLATQYPLSTAACGALYAAAERLIEAGDDRQAISHLSRAFEEAKDKDIRIDLMATIASTCERMDQPRRARRWLLQLQREYPDADIEIDGEQVNLDAWLVRLQALQSMQGQMPSLYLPLRSPIVLEGRLLSPTHQPDGVWSNKVLLTQVSQTVQCYRVEDLSPTWRITTPDTHTQLLAISNEQALLWSESAGWLAAIDLASGEPIWPQVDVNLLLESIGDEQQVRQMQPEAQRQFEDMLNPGNFQRMLARRRGRAEPEPQTTDLLITINDQVFCLADRSGRTVAINRDTGRILWQRVFGFREMINAQLDDDVLMLAGNVGLINDTQSGSILIVDPRTGQQQTNIVEDRNTLTWAGMAGDRLVIYSTNKNVAAHQIDNGKLAWRLPFNGRNFPSSGVSSRDHVLLQDESGTMQIIDVEDGRVVKTLVTSTAPTTAQPIVQSLDGRWYIMTPWQSFALDEEGLIAWRDGVRSHQKSLLAQLIADQHVVLIANGEERMWRPAREEMHNVMEVQVEAEPPARMLEQIEVPQVQPGGWAYRLFILDRKGGAVLEERTVGPLQERLISRSAALLDGMIVLSTATHSIVIPAGK